MARFIRNITLLKLGFDKSYSVVFIFTLYWWFDFRFCYSWLIQCLVCSGDAVLTAVTFSLHIPVIDKIISYAILCKRHLHIHTTNTSGECLVLSCWSQSCFDSYTKAQSFVFICGQPSATGSLQCCSSGIG